MPMKKKPRKVKEREGTVNTTRDGKEGQDLDPGGVVGPPPRHLPAVAKTFWRKAAEWMERMSISKACDELHLEHAAMLYYRLREANKYLVKHGAMDPKTGKRNGAAVEAMQCGEKLRMWYGEVGFTPSARASLGVNLGDARNPGGDQDLEAQIFGKGKSKRPGLKAV